MQDPQKELREMEPKHDYLVAIDSDGCAFDTMEIKHKECFIPNIIKYWKLQPVSKYARAAAEFVNLYSKWRGVNRFPALIKTFDLLREWDDVRKRHIEVPEAKPLREWIERETKLGNPALKAEVERTGEPILENALEWSEAVNRTVAEIVHGVPPFPFVKESLEKLSQKADIIVCSATPVEALRREWAEHKIEKYVRVIAGQEMGSKKEHIQLASQGKYEQGKILMIGDAPGDMKAARANNALFYPINPGGEEDSWERFFREGIDKFLNGTYTKDYEKELINEFEKLLPELAPWQKGKFSFHEIYSG
ncbi:MAG: HAD family hydrolase [Candidatus Marinimicrobia bacterium]|nr:HAD family hydrolase [Candidatus Neomarinimicrobiota bacterium]